MKIWRLDNGDVYKEDELETAADVICDPDYYEDNDAFDEHLDYEEGAFDVCGHTFSASEILYNLNENAYYDELREWAQNKAEEDYPEVLHHLKHMESGEEQWFNNYRVSCEETEDETDEEESSAEKEAKEHEEVTVWQNVFTVKVL